MCKLTINGYPLDESFDYGKIFPWSDDIVKVFGNTAILVGDIMVLWCIKRELKVFPKYLEKNYVENTNASIQKMENCSLVLKRKITSKGIDLLNENKNIIDLHRKGWFTPKDKENANEFQNKKDEAYIKQLKGFGEIERLNEFIFRRKEEHIRGGLFNIFEMAERMSKDSDFDESNQILKKLLSSKIANSAEIYWRLAINYRKLKDYSKEIDIINLALKKENMQWSRCSKEDFKKRLIKAKKLLK